MAKPKVSEEGKLEIEDEEKTFADVVKAFLEWLRARQEKQDKKITKLNEVLS